MKQRAYAMRVWGAKDETRHATALNVGYSEAVARSPGTKLENQKGFNNAMAALAAESNNLALTILHEFKSRGVQDFSNKDLVGALNAIGQAWSKFNGGVRTAEEQQSKNRLRTVVLQNIEHQTFNASPKEEPEPVIVPEEDFPNEEDSDF